VDHILWITPIKKGKTDVVRRYMGALEGSRRADYEGSQEELNMIKEIFWLRPARNEDENDHLVLYMEAEDMEQAFKDWHNHKGDFETYGKAQWAEFSEEIPDPLWQGPNESPYVLECLSYYQHPGGPPAKPYEGPSRD
jgi:Family of unknown function (DUF6176)